MKLSSFVVLACLMTSSSMAKVKPVKKTTFKSDKANKEIVSFLQKRWGRQLWQIEKVSFSGNKEEKPRWVIKGTIWAVRFDSPEHWKEFLNLKKLDSNTVYEFTGVPVDQNYGVITFYALSGLEKVKAAAKAKGVDEDLKPAVPKR